MPILVYTILIITNKGLGRVTAMLDKIIEEYKEETKPKKRDWKTYEQKLIGRLKKAFKELKPLVAEAARAIKSRKGEPKGNRPVLSLEQKVLVLLIKHLLGKSNRGMSCMFIIFSWLNNIDVSYKTIERLYSDEQLILALFNMHILMLKKRGVKEADCCGDGTGYALCIKVHYASEAQKLKDKLKENGEKKSTGKKTKVIYSFALMDLKTRMYIGYGTSFKSENEAFYNAMDMVKETGVKINSIRLDRYYSKQGYVKFLIENFGKMNFYLIPKTNSTIKGPREWKQMLASFVDDTKCFLREYYRRNQSESSWSEDKKRTGWKLGQKKPERIETANDLTGVWHNLSWLNG